MHPSIVRQLVMKDLAIMKIPVICWWLGGVASVALVVFGGPAFFIAGFMLFVTGMAGAGIHAVMQTVMEERREQTLPFIMSLPITVKEYTSAKLIANLAIFTTVWLTLSVASFVIFVGDEGMPAGAIPFVAIILVSIFLAYTAILMICLVMESIGYSVGAIIGANLLTQIYLRGVYELHGIRSVFRGSTAEWNTTALAVLGVQIVAILILITLTYVLQARKKDFI